MLEERDWFSWICFTNNVVCLFLLFSTPGVRLGVEPAQTKLDLTYPGCFNRSKTVFLCRHYAALKTMEQLEKVYIPR